jgi:hypothetical protein
MLVTLAEMKAYLGIVVNTYDAFLTEQINIVSSAIENYCGRKFNQATYNQKFYRDEMERTQKFLEMYQYPLVSVTSVKEDTVLVDAAEYRVQLPWARITKLYLNFFSNYAKEIEIIYSAGFVAIPYEIKSVVYSLVEEKYTRKISGVPLNFGTDVQRVSIPGTISVDFDYSLNTNERKNKYGTILGSYLNVLDAWRSERVVIGGNIFNVS